MPDFIGFLKFGESWDKKNREMFKDVKRSAESGASGYFRTGSSQIREKDVSDETKEAFKLAAAVYHRTLISGRNEEASAARNYLYGRGFTESTIRDLKIGYAGRSELHKNGLSLPPAERTGYIERMRKAGFIRDGREYFTNRIIFPNITKDGRVLNLTGRAVGNSARRYLNIPNVKKNLYLLELADPGEELYLTESVPDAVTLYQLGYSAAAANGTALSGQMKAALDAYGQIIIVPQNDSASMNAACRWCEAIPRCRILLPEYMDGKEKDINDILRLEGERLNQIDDFTQRISAADTALQILKHVADLLRGATDIRRVAKRLQAGQQICFDEFDQLVAFEGVFKIERAVCFDRPCPCAPTQI